MECEGVFNWSWTYSSLILSNRFRWVYCQLEALRPCFPNNLRRMLEELPKSLDETYQRILKDINTANHKQAHQLLQCLAAAYRPLLVEELAEVLALDVDAGGIPRFNAKWRWEDHEEAVLSACSSLVSVVIHYGSRVVQFSHFSVKEFLTSDRLASMEDLSQFHIADEPSHVILAQVCIGVLLSLYDHTSEDSAKDIALLPYAEKYLGEHAHVGQVELRIQDALDCLFDVDKPHFEALFRREGDADNLRLYRVPSDEDPEGVLSPAAPFFVACAAGFSGLAERLIVSNQPQVIGFRLQGWTLLHIMVHKNKKGVARLLLAHGADINSRPDYATPLHIASLQSPVERPVEGGLEEIDEIENILQNSDADVSSEESNDDSVMRDYKRKSGFTPLHIAVKEGYFDMCQMLLEHKADVHAHDSKGNTPLHLASDDDHLEIFRILLEYNAEVNSRNKDGSTPLLIASSNGNINLFRLLLAHNAHAFVHDNRGNTPLHVATFGGHLEVVRNLLELKADVDSLNSEGLTPFQQALEGQGEAYLDIVWLLLNHGADAKVHGKSGNTLLHFAAFTGDLELARISLEHSPEVINSQNEDGSTAFHLGLRRRNIDVAQLLLDHSADVHMHDKHGNTPLYIAVCNEHLDICRILLERKVEVNCQNDHGSTPLLFASRFGTPDIVQLLLDHHADVHVRDVDGNTLLHHAAIAGHLEVARLVLLKLNADINSRNEMGSTPLHLASAGHYWKLGGNPDVVRLLLDHGADEQAQNLSGETASEVARGPKKHEIVQLLSENATQFV